MGSKRGEQGASPPAEEAMPWGWSMAQVCAGSGATAAMEKICRERKKEKKGKKQRHEKCQLNGAVFNWYHQGLCAVSTLFMFIIESPNSTDLKGI